MRILVVDDSVIFRQAVSKILKASDSSYDVDTAVNGKTALEKISFKNYDAITLDLEMPEVSGIEVLEQLHKKNINIPVIILSAHSVEGGVLTMKALELNAYDFVPKISTQSPAESMEYLKEHLIPLIKTIESGALKQRKLVPKIQMSISDVQAPALKRKKQYKIEDSELVVIGVSTGGPNALATIFPLIRSDINVPIIVIQHMPPIFTKSLAQHLSLKCGLNVVEATGRGDLLPGVVYIAPGGRQLKIIPTDRAGKFSYLVTDDPPENNCAPSVDYTFRSVAQNVKYPVLSIILTGMGNDGAQGMKLLKSLGNVTIAQNESTCVVYGMPRVVVEAGIVDHILPLDEIPCYINKIERRLKNDKN